MEVKNLPISNRLKMNAAMVKGSSVLADVGCDHAYCSIYLAGNGIAQRCIAMDINRGPLARAQENIRLYGLEERIETRLSNGLERLAPGEADTILISGMGGPLMQEILERGAACVRAARQLVLQPQSEIAEFRKYLHMQGLYIVEEDMCCEDGKYYVTMRVENAPVPEMESELQFPEKLAFCYGACLLKKKHPVLREFLEREYQKKQELWKQLDEKRTERSVARMTELAQEIEELGDVLTLLQQ